MARRDAGGGCASEYHDVAGLGIGAGHGLAYVDEQGRGVWYIDLKMSKSVPDKPRTIEPCERRNACVQVRHAPLREAKRYNAIGAGSSVGEAV